MTPEERAQDICHRVTNLADWRDREAIIAAAILEAENAALERAALVATGPIEMPAHTFKVGGEYLTDAAGGRYFLSHAAANDMLERKGEQIRALKHPEG